MTLGEVNPELYGRSHRHRTDVGRARRDGAIAVLAFFVANLVLALTVIPPWQNPDEPQHLDTIRRILMFGPNFTLDMHDVEGERAAVASMADHGWWQHYGLPTPDPLPTTFVDGPAKVVGGYFGPPGGGSRLYYGAVAESFRVLHIDNLLWQLYAMRLMSAFAGLLTLYVLWAGTRLLVGETAALVVSSLAALHPQFALAATTAGPDAWVNLAGAIFWWRMGALFAAAGSTSLNLFLLWAAAIMAFVIRRMGAPLLIIAGIVTLTELVRSLTPRRSSQVLRTAGIALAIPLLVGAVWPFLPEDVHRGYAWVQFDLRGSSQTILDNASQIPRFLKILFTTFWLSAGWLRYAPPRWWSMTTAVLSGLSFLGFVVAVVRSRRRQLVFVMTAMLLLQCAAVVAYDFGVLGSAPQGRYLFPVLPSILCMIWIGWRHILIRWTDQRMSAFALIAIMAVLDLSAWNLVIVPSYAN